MSRKLTLALVGLLLLTMMLATPVWAATAHLMPHSQGSYHALFIPAIILIVYMLVGGALSIAFLIWAFNHHVWPFS
jgi:hypothetical protein